MGWRKESQKNKIELIFGLSESTKRIFEWKEEPEVDYYIVFIKKLTPDQIIIQELDTVVYSNEISLRLLDGKYRWDVIGINSAYETKCCNDYFFDIASDTSNFLSNKIIKLVYPSNLLELPTNQIGLKWEKLIGAEKYDIQIGNSTFTSIIESNEISDTCFIFTAPSDGSFSWRVRGINESTLSITQWKSSMFIIDRNPPSKPILTFPLNNDSLEVKIESPDLKWLSSIESESDSAFIYLDQFRENLWHSFKSINKQLELDSILVQQIPAGSALYWEVYSFDKAGNKSLSSGQSVFFIK